MVDPRPEDQLDTQAHNARLLRAYFGDELKYVPERDHWFEWEGNRWRAGPGQGGIGAPKARAVEMVRTFKERDAAVADRLRTARSCETKQHIRGVCDLADPYMRLAWSEFDTHEGVLVTPNAYVNLRAGDLFTKADVDLFSGKQVPINEAGARALYMTARTDAGWDPEATCPTWERALLEWMPDETEVEAFQRAAGYALTGTARERKMVICHGPKGTGKTTCLNALKHAAGEYGRELNVETLMRTFNESGRQADPEVAGLAGARLVVTSEVNEGRRLNEAKVKRLVSQGTVLARFLYGNPFPINITWCIFMDSNRLPVIREDEAALDRILIAPFVNEVGTRDKTLPGVLRAEAAGILRWMVEGAVAYYADGLLRPTRWDDALADYASECTPFDLWYGECADHTPGIDCKRTDVVESIEWFYDAEGFPRDAIPSHRKLKGLLEDRGHEGYKRMRGAWFRDLTVTGPQDALDGGGDDG